MLNDKSILIIEPDELKSNLLQFWLDRTPFKVNYITKDSNQLFDILSEHHFDIVIVQAEYKNFSIAKYLLDQVIYNHKIIFITENENKTITQISKLNKNISFLIYPFERTNLIHKLIELNI